MVQSAFNKNKALANPSVSDTTPLGRLIAQRRLWTSLQETFFAPGADADMLAASSALTSRDLAACPCQQSRRSCTARTPSKTTTTTTSTAHRAQSRTTSTVAATTATKHPLARCVSVTPVRGWLPLESTACSEESLAATTKRRISMELACGPQGAGKRPFVEMVPLLEAMPVVV